MKGALKVEYLLEGDETPEGVVQDVTGMGGKVIVDYQDGTSRTYTRGETVEVTG